MKQTKPPGGSIEEKELLVREGEETNLLLLLYLNNVSALKIMLYLVHPESIISCCLTAGLTLYWYFAYSDNHSSWQASSLDFILLTFAVISPISAAIGMAFARRERALISIASFRGLSYHLYLSHCVWDWNGDAGRADAARTNKINWLEHCDAMLVQLIGIGDELHRFLTLPTSSRGRHRLTQRGADEASRTEEVAYDLFQSLATQRITRLSMLTEKFKALGIATNEISRIRQYEQKLTDCLEQLRMVKVYRTPQALRSFARIFTLLLPPFYAPKFAQVAKDVESLGVGVAFGVITALALTALFESLAVLEDPFTALLVLDGINVREELEVMHFAQLINTRKLIFPDAPDYPIDRCAAVPSDPPTRARPTYSDSNSRIIPPQIPPAQEHKLNPGAFVDGACNGLPFGGDNFSEGVEVQGNGTVTERVKIGDSASDGAVVDGVSILVGDASVDAGVRTA